MDSSSPDPSSSRAEKQLERFEQRIEAIEQQLERLSELAARAYENTPRMAAELLTARRHPSYPAAYAASPLVTVRIGTYGGGAELFERALESVRRQTYSNWEVVVVCDGRDDETAAGIASLEDSRIRCFQRPRNGPYPLPAFARWQATGAHPFNEAVALARGAWIAPIDDDDEWADDHLEILLDSALRTHAEVVYGVSRVIVGSYGETYFGTWPPSQGDFGFQAALYHSGLTAFLYDANSYLVNEVADWNLARRMLEAGVRFEFLERSVTTYYVKGDATKIAWWEQRVRERGAFDHGKEVHRGTDG